MGLKDQRVPSTCLVEDRAAREGILLLSEVVVEFIHDLRMYPPHKNTIGPFGE